VLNQDIDYTVNWVDQTITLLANVSTGEIINIDVYEIGGGSQLYRMNYIGSEIINSNVIVPVSYAQLVDVSVFINGNIVSNAVDLEPYTDSVVYNNNFTYQSLAIVYNDNEITITNTNGTSNSITCNNTTTLTVGQPMVFFGTGFGGIVAGQTYYVQNIISGTQFSISSVAGATTPDVLTTASGTMTAQPKGTY
jgi:hypothetical protein